MSVFCLAALTGFSLALRINKFKITSGIKRQVLYFIVLLILLQRFLKTEDKTEIHLKCCFCVHIFQMIKHECVFIEALLYILDSIYCTSVFRVVHL